uniref:Anaphase-promoting complex subunit 13 n=1 Tax=Caenorhabditis tropicalis TaxID=1561998 RepID=A0A1I7TZV6_9PELO
MVGVYVNESHKYCQKRNTTAKSFPYDEAAAPGKMKMFDVTAFSPNDVYVIVNSMWQLQFPIVPPANNPSDSSASGRIANLLSRPFRSNPLKRTKSVSKMEKSLAEANQK